MMFPKKILEKIEINADIFENCLMIAYKKGDIKDKNTIESSFKYRFIKYAPNWYDYNLYSDEFLENKK